MEMSDENTIKLEIDYNECKIHFLFEKEKAGAIRFRINPYHNQNYYLDMDFEGIDLNNAERIVGEIAQRLDKPLQVMISSEEGNKIAMLEAVGFLCKRKCYEIEAQKKDYIGENCEGEILYSHAGEEIYKQCCERMLDRYVMTHNSISPWTGSKEEFFAELPYCVAYFCMDGKPSCFAFLEDEEIAYVCGENLQEFRRFSQMLVSEMFRKHEFITFEADDCDEIAMELKSLFVNQAEESFDTYVYGRH